MSEAAEIVTEDQSKPRPRRAVAVHAHHEPAQFSEEAAILSLVERAASNPAVDMDKLERLVQMQKEARADRARAAFDTAMAQMQPDLKPVDERGGIKGSNGKVQSTYALWEDVCDAIMPVLTTHGFNLSFRVENPPGIVSVTAILGGHGHREQTTLNLPIDGSGSKNAVQAIGSSTSYGKRYTAGLLLNLTSRGMDDDGKAAGASDLLQRALSDINLAEGLDELRKWKADKYDGLSRMLSANEMREVVDLYNRRIRTAKTQAEGRSNG